MQYGFYLDTTSCIACGTCWVACKDANALDVTENYRIASAYEAGTYPMPLVLNISTGCNHCENPACAATCPTGATFVAEDGTVQHDEETCIGCKSCVEACPFDVPVYREGRGVVGKCDSCAALRAEGEDPACVASCKQRCLMFGDFDELKGLYGADAVSPDTLFGIGAESSTGPRALYKVHSWYADAASSLKEARL